MIDWSAWGVAQGIDCITQESQLAKLSQDYFHFSPILTPLLQDKRAKAVLRPTTEAEVIKIAQACVTDREFLTVRGSGTGNYGQCVPLAGGIILDTTKMQQIHWLKPGAVCVDPGVKLAQLDLKAQEIGWESRMVPSTYRTATIGGFIAGGSGGIGSILYGQLRDRGNLQGVRVVTLTDPPQTIVLEGEAVQQVNHGYGVNGVITQLTMPLAPAYPWQPWVVRFAEFGPAAEFGLALGNCDGIIKKLITVFADPIPGYLPGLRDVVSPGSALVLALVNQPDRLAFRELVQEYDGTLLPGEDYGNLIEYTWNHTTLHARAADPNLTYLQCIYPDLQRIDRLRQQFPEELLMHLEFIRSAGKVVAAAIPLVRFTTPDRLEYMIKTHEDQGVFVANPHTYLLEDGGMKTINQEQLEFKRVVDPFGLMNPGKMRAWLAA